MDNSVNENNRPDVRFPPKSKNVGRSVVVIAVSPSKSKCHNTRPKVMSRGGSS